MKHSFAIGAAAGALSLWGATTAAESPYDRLTNISTVVVLATVQSIELVIQPEALVPLPVRVLPDGTFAITLPEDDGIRGRVMRVRVDEVLKRDRILAVGGLVDIYDPLFGVLIARWLPQVGAQYALFLKRDAYTDEQRRERSLIMRRLAAGSTGEGSLLDLENTYSLVSLAKGAVRTDTLKPAVLDALRNDVAAAARPRVTLTQPVEGAVLSGQVTLSATAVDDGGVAGVQFTVDGQNVGPELTRRPFEYVWRSKSVPNGAHTVAALARDGSGDSASASAAVTTWNTNVPPQLGVDPASAVGGAKFVTWSWLDPDGDPLACQFEVLQPAQCSAGDACSHVGGSASGSTTCQLRVGYGQPAGTSCDFRLTCSDGWASAAASFNLYYPNLLPN